MVLGARHRSADRLITYVDGDNGVLLYRGYSDRRSRRAMKLILKPAGRPSTANCRPAVQLDKFAHDITHHTILNGAAPRNLPRVPPLFPSAWP